MDTTTQTDRAAVKKALVGRDYIETIDWTVDEIEEALAVSLELKAERKAGSRHRLLPTRRCSCSSSTSRRAPATPSRRA